MSRTPPPLTAEELQEMARTCIHERERRLLWEVSRIRRILRMVNEFEFMVRDERRAFHNEPEIQRIADALRAALDKEPAIREGRAREAARDPHKAKYRAKVEYDVNGRLVVPVGDDGD